MSLYISINTASARLSNSLIYEAVTLIAAHASIAKRQGRLPNGPSLDLTFLLPGEYETPPFVGMRMGNYTIESDTLFFETAVPKQILQSDQAPRYVAVVMLDVIEHASEFFLEKKIEFDISRWREFIATLPKTAGQAQNLH